jgi:hypothetical protein
MVSSSKMSDVYMVKRMRLKEHGAGVVNIPKVEMKLYALILNYLQCIFKYVIIWGCVFERKTA